LLFQKITVVNYNQIKGRKMTAFFKDSSIEKILVNGNGESIYFALEEEDNSLIGMNKILCSDMSIQFQDNKIKDILFYMKPNGKLIPPSELQDPDRRLQGFVWRNEERPIRDKMKVSQIMPENLDSAVEGVVLEKLPNVEENKLTYAKILPKRSENPLIDKVNNVKID